jgi:hypothetical protein
MHVVVNPKCHGYYPINMRFIGRRYLYHPRSIYTSLLYDYFLHVIIMKYILKNKIQPLERICTPKAERVCLRYYYGHCISILV